MYLEVDVLNISHIYFCWELVLENWRPNIWWNCIV